MQPNQSSDWGWKWYDEKLDQETPARKVERWDPRKIKELEEGAPSNHTTLPLIDESGSNSLTQGDDKANEETGTSKDEVPSFDGTNPRAYLRKVKQWNCITTIPQTQRAMALLCGLHGDTWGHIEHMDRKRLNTKHGVEMLMHWVWDNYLESGISDNTDEESAGNEKEENFVRQDDPQSMANT